MAIWDKDKDKGICNQGHLFCRERALTSFTSNCLKLWPGERMDGGNSQKAQLEIPTWNKQTLYCRFWTFEQGFFGKKLQYDFPKMRGGGQRPFGNSPKIHAFWYCHLSLSTEDALRIPLITISSNPIPSVHPHIALKTTSHDWHPKTSIEHLRTSDNSVRTHHS